MNHAERDALRTHTFLHRDLPAAPVATGAAPPARLVRDPRKRCDHCAFWEHARAAPGQAQYCRRHAPLVGRVTTEEVETVWPETLASDWCGEFRPHPGLPA